MELSIWTALSATPITCNDFNSFGIPSETMKLSGSSQRLLGAPTTIMDFRLGNRCGILAITAAIAPNVNDGSISDRIEFLHLGNNTKYERIVR